MGNHEPYRGDIDLVTDNLRTATASPRSRVIFLENDSVETAGVHVLGCTLWTDYALNGDPGVAMHDAARGMADHRLISTRGRRFMPADAPAKHRESLAWLHQETARVRKDDPDAKIVILTHHAPVAQANSPRYRGGRLASAFASDLRRAIRTLDPAVWVSGHTHHDIDLKVGRTRVVSAQRGYLGQEPGAVKFLPKIIEV